MEMRRRKLDKMGANACVTTMQRLATSNKWRDGRLGMT